VATNDIKIDSVAANSYPRYNTQPVNDTGGSDKPVEGVQISNSVNNLVGQLSQSSGAEIDDKRVEAMIATLKGHYQVDYNQLAHNLVIELLKNSTSPLGMEHVKPK
jgi:anti-sigma28 factor (negative regulator of flagellin synthesis)